MDRLHVGLGCTLELLHVGEGDAEVEPAPGIARPQLQGTGVVGHSLLTLVAVRVRGGQLLQWYQPTNKPTSQQVNQPAIRTQQQCIEQQSQNGVKTDSAEAM